MFFHVVSAEYATDHRVRLAFQDGSTGEADLFSFLSADTVFAGFRDPGYFKDFRLEYGTLTWGNGEVDVAPEALYQLATGKEIEYSRSSKTGHAVLRPKSDANGGESRIT